MNKYVQIIERMLSSSGTSPVSLPGITIIEIAGFQRVLVENHCGVIAYGTCEIRIRTNYGCISISGRKLNLAIITRERLVITGEIDGLSLHKGGSK